MLAALLPLRCATQPYPTAPATQPHLTALNAFKRPAHPSGMSSVGQQPQCLPSGHSACHSAPTPPHGVPCQACRLRKRWLPCFQELDDRRKFLEALSEKYTVSGIPEPGPLAELPPLPEEEAILVIQVGVLCSSRDGQQAVACSASMLSSQVLGNGALHCAMLVQKPAAASSLINAMCVSAGPA